MFLEILDIVTFKKVDVLHYFNIIEFVDELSLNFDDEHRANVAFNFEFGCMNWTLSTPIWLYELDLGFIHPTKYKS